MNEFYFFEDTNPLFLYTKWVPEYIPEYDYRYNYATFRMENVLVKKYQNVCPLYTYRKDDFCYKEPVN